MKEIIINITADATMASGHKVVIPNAADYASFGKNNVLGILNKTRTQSHFTPMQWANLTSVVYDSSAHTLTLNLAAASYPITAGDELFVKLYSDAGGDSSDMLAQFFGLPDALPEYTYATDQEVIDIVDDVYNDYFPNAVQAAEINNNN